VKRFLFLLAVAFCTSYASVSDLRWQLRLEKALGSSAAPPDDGLVATNAPDRLLWEDRAKSLKIGMPRSEVEQVLPPYNWPDAGPHPTVGSCIENEVPKHRELMYQWYYVAPNFIAVFFYDRTGPRNWSGTGPNQRLMKIPEIVHYDFTRKQHSEKKSAAK